MFITGNGKPRAWIILALCGFAIYAFSQRDAGLTPAEAQAKRAASAVRDAETNRQVKQAIRQRDEAEIARRALAQAIVDSIAPK